jgi:hypothetical protein
MGTIIASSLIDKVAEELEDRDFKWWSADYHLKSLNEAQKKVVILKPDSNTIIEPVPMIPGAKQTLPIGAFILEKIRMNMGVGGTTRGAPITLVDMDTLGAVLPGWASAPPALVVVHYMYDLSSPLVYFVYPPQPLAPGYVEMEYAALPIDISRSLPIILPDEYEQTLKHYMKYKAWESKKPDIATAYYSMFLADLGLSDAREDADDPNEDVGRVKGGPK